MKLGNQRLALEVRRAFAPFIALTVIAVSGLFAIGWVLSNQNTQHPWEDYVDVRATMDDVKGVLPGKQEVRIAGVRVGVIKDAELVNGRPEITLAVQRKYAPIYRNATLRLRSQTALEDKFINLDRGTPDAGRLRASDVVPLQQTSVPVDVSRILQTFDGDTAANLRYVLAGLGKGLDDGGAALNRAVVELAPFLDVAKQTTDQLATRKARLADLVTKTGELTTAIGRHDRALSKLITAGNETLATLGARDTRLDATLQALPPTIASVKRALATFGRVRTELNPALASLRPSARALGPAMTALQDTARVLAPAARSLQPSVSALAPLARDLVPLSSSLRSALGGVRPQVPDVDLATKQVDACHQAYEDFFLNTLSLFKMDDSFQALGRGEVTVGPLIRGERRGVTTDQVGLSKPQDASPGYTGGLTRFADCTERKGVSTFSTKDGR